MLFNGNVWCDTVQHASLMEGSCKADPLAIGSQAP